MEPSLAPGLPSNGVIGIRVQHIPMLRGNTIVSGFDGEHPEAHIPALRRLRTRFRQISVWAASRYQTPLSKCASTSNGTTSNAGS
jgi:hypothetical protein